MNSKTSKSLFSQHYLERRLPEHPEWREEVTAVLQKARALYDAKKEALPGYNEAQTEQEFIQPILEEVLGFAGAYTVQTAAHHGARLQRPDYALFANEAGKIEADRHLGDEAAFFARAVAVADAKYWERPLSKRGADGRRGRFDNRNPGHQIVSYLIAAGTDWGVLTNGRVWRLYSRQVSGPATEFYEVDLVELLQGRPEDFKRFWLFFRRRAFIPDAQGNTFLDRVRQGSAAYARVIGDRLKDRVFDQIFPLLAGGFVADAARRGETVDDEATRTLIYESTLSLLYKLLFLLYGEARRLLPIANRGYRRQSLTGVARDVAERLDQDEPLGERAAWLYDRLLNLFRLIDAGDRGVGLPRYNGGLFHFDFGDAAARRENRENWFLTQHKIDDRRLARALDLLGRVEGEAIDYGFIGVRHLGAIYEGLLEYRLVIDDAAAGLVHLENDKGERKATGSYYTPDYIVKYIVRHTLAPILAARRERFAAQMAEIVPKRRRLAELGERLAGDGLTAAVESRYRNEAQLLRGELADREAAARRTLLEVKVCDPAMGSGHFLVEVVDFLTTNLVTILNEYPEYNPILDWLGQIRGQILENMAGQGITVDPERLDDTQLLQRVVMKRCIYGVDLNRMAVELAKVSLWLHTFTVGAPLSFLDHHLRWGDSLVGAMAREAEAALAPDAAEGQMALSFMSGPFAGLLRAAEIMRGISGLSDATLAEVEQSEALFRDFDRQAKPYKRLLDVFAMRPFVDKAARQAANDFLLYEGERAVAAVKAGAEAAAAGERLALQTARELYRRHRFFHWDLEFPEVFIDLERADWKANPGFDAVVGNPPYVRQEQLRAFKPYFKQAYEKVYAGTADLFVYFFGRALELLKEGGRTSYISSNSWLRANYATNLRAYLRQETTIETLIDLGDNRVFEDAPDLYPSIHVVKKERSIGDHRAKVAIFDRDESVLELETQLQSMFFEVSFHNQEDSGWQLESDNVRGLFAKLMQTGEDLAEVAEGKTYYGIKTGLNAAFIVEPDLKTYLYKHEPAAMKFLRPLARGGGLRPWYQIVEEWLIRIPAGWTRQQYGDKKRSNLSEGQAWELFSEDYPKLAEYLHAFADRARKRYDQGEYWWELRPCDYYEAFEQPKIFWPDITKYPRFSWDDTGIYVNDKGFILLPPHESLLGILQSRAIWFCIARLCVPLGERAGLMRYQLKSQFISQLPIPEMSEPEHEAVGALAMEITENANERYALHKRTRHRIRTDLAGGREKLGNKLTAWWELDFSAFREEIKRRFKRDIPVAERDQWQAWLDDRRAEHERYTAVIIRLETELNERVYALFNLTPDEIQIIEESTKYNYGEV